MPITATMVQAGSTLTLPQTSDGATVGAAQARLSGSYANQLRNRLAMVVSIAVPKSPLHFRAERVLIREVLALAASQSHNQLILVLTLGRSFGILVLRYWETAMKVGIYARVSTKGQAADMQLAELRAYCQRRGWDAVEYVDRGVSGSKEHRPALDKLLKAARRREIEAVVVYRYDRFARSLRQLVNALGEFNALGIGFVSLHENVDTTTPQGRLVFGIFASIAEFERELIRERVKDGVNHARSKGIKLGRPERLDAEQQKAILACRKEGMTYPEIAKRFKVGRMTVIRVVQAHA